MGENVKVAVRVRPFNDREKNMSASCIISMSGKSTTIINPNSPNDKPKRFTYDQSYWSHDGCTERADGYLEPANQQYIDQKKVFEDLGAMVLDNAWQGYNCCLFAYGQTGSGKSYSIVGYGSNKGIIPVACEELFNRITDKSKTAQEDQEFQVFVGMIEIYNEQVRDLLNPNSFKVKGGLKVREHPEKGFYVETQAKFPVQSYTDINSKINEGTRNRTIASTNMNATSSRAHTIVSITFVQKGKNDRGQNMTKTSIINLVDLAGSERVESTGATGDRLKEGAAINLSLSSLGNVIKALADMGAGKKGMGVPYRDSKLTMLLKNALGGNSKTIMIAAISPADVNYEETLSTLRYADRAKAIKTKAVVNESPTAKLIRELKQENARLLAELQKGGGGGDQVAIMQGIPEEEVQEMKRELEERLRRNQSEMDAMKQSWEQRLKEYQTFQEEELEKERQKREAMKVTPHFWNLNEDPALTGMVIHFAQPGIMRVGNSKANPQPEILLSGLNIQKEHAVVTNHKSVVAVKPCPNAKVLLNGKEITNTVELHHNDRIMFGSRHLYVLHHPQDLAKNHHKEKSPTYDSAQAEIAANSGFDMNKGPDKSKDDLLLQEALIELMPMVSEANALSEELKKGVRFEIALISPQSRGLKHGRTEVSVLMLNLDNDNEFLWGRNKFLNRKYLMQEMYLNFIDGDEDWDKEKDNDPFWEPPDTEVLIGCVHVYLQSLAYLIEVEELLGVTDYRGLEQGLLKVDIYPCTENGSELSEEEFVDDPKELLGKSVTFKINVVNACGLPSRICKSQCKYKFYLDDMMHKTNGIEGTRNPDFNHTQTVSCQTVTEQFLEYLEKDFMVIEVWGQQKGGNSNKKALTTNSYDAWIEQERYDMQVELHKERKRVARLEAKMLKLHGVIARAKQEDKDLVDVKEIDDILTGRGHPERFRAAARLIAMAERAKNSQGQIASDSPRDVRWSYNLETWQATPVIQILNFGETD